MATLATTIINLNVRPDEVILIHEYGRQGYVFVGLSYEIPADLLARRCPTATRYNKKQKYDDIVSYDISIMIE